MARWLVFCALAAAAAAPPLELTVDPRPGKQFEATFTGLAPGVRSGEFRGSVAWNGSTAEIPLIGRADRVGEKLRLRATLLYADIPTDWMNRFQPDAFDYRIRGEVAGSGPVSWSGTEKWNQVSVLGDDRTVGAFVKLASLELTALSPRRSEGRAVLDLVNPFSFPIELAGSTYRLRIDGEDVGSGAGSGRILKARKSNALELPFTIDPRRFFAAAGAAWAAGTPLDTELAASLTLRLSGRDLKVPLRFRRRMGTEAARSAAEIPLEGATSLSPHR